MRAQLLVIGVVLSGCEAEPRRTLTPKVFDAELKVAPSSAVPNRKCELTGEGKIAKTLLVRGHVGYEEGDEDGRWEIVAPVDWSSNAVSSRFDMGLGGESEHRWQTRAGLMQAEAEWWDETEPNGADSRITITTPDGTNYKGSCRPIEAEKTGSDT